MILFSIFPSFKIRVATRNLLLKRELEEALYSMEYKDHEYTPLTLSSAAFRTGLALPLGLVMPQPETKAVAPRYGSGVSWLLVDWTPSTPPDCGDTVGQV